MKYKYEMVVKPTADGRFVASSPSLPGYVGEGATAADAAAKLKDVITAHLKSHSEQESPKCDMADCEVEPMYHFTGIKSRRVAFEQCLCDLHAKEFFADFRSSESIGGGSRHVVSGAVCVDLEMVASYRMGREKDPVCMYVHEVGGIRRLCILTDGWARCALLSQIKEETSPRPRTHDAWAATIGNLGGQLQDVVLDRHEGEHWWTAKVRIVRNASLVTLDVRATDAFVLAVINGVPIFVVETALEKFADRGEGGGT